jgi:benzodiazapine receptor
MQKRSGSVSPPPPPLKTFLTFPVTHDVSQVTISFAEPLFWQILLIIIALALLASQFTNEGLLTAWYDELPQAPWRPPTWLFTFAWTLLYLIIAVTAYIGIKLDPLWIVFGILVTIGMFLNVLWCFVFFTSQNIYGGFAVIVLLDIVVALQIIYLFLAAAKTRRPALWVSGALLLLYLVWGIYATTINGYITFTPVNDNV